MQTYEKQTKAPYRHSLQQQTGEVKEGTRV